MSNFENEKKAVVGQFNKPAYTLKQLMRFRLQAVRAIRLCPGDQVKRGNDLAKHLASIDHAISLRGTTPTRCCLPKKKQRAMGLMRPVESSEEGKENFDTTD